jgi:hypothetical protein
MRLQYIGIGYNICKCCLPSTWMPNVNKITNEYSINLQMFVVFDFLINFDHSSY